LAQIWYEFQINHEKFDVDYFWTKGSIFRFWKRKGCF